MSRVPFGSFEKFWTHYVRQHQHPATRLLHFLGTLIACILCGSGLAWQHWPLVLMGPMFGYGLAWLSHFLVEKNQPATFTHPIWSLIGDFKMFAMMLLGHMNREVQRVRAESGVGQPADDGQPGGRRAA